MKTKIKSIKYEDVAFLEILTWVGCFGHHYYGTLKFRKKRFNVTYKLTSKQVKILMDGEKHPYFFEYKAGEMSERFLDIDLLIRRAKRTWKKELPNAKVLLEGNSGVVDPQKCIGAVDNELKKKLNKLWSAAKEIDYWADEEKMQIIHDKWSKLIIF